MHAFADHSIPLTFPITCPFCPLTFQTDRAVTNHACQMKGKCALTEPAAQNSLQDNSAEQARDLIADLRLTTRSGTSTGGANAAGRGTIPRRASKGTGIGSTGDKTKTGRISKSGSANPPHQWRKPPTDDPPTEPCPVCKQKFHTRYGLARHLYNNMTDMECLTRILREEELQKGLFLIARAGDPPTIGGLKFKIGCPWCSCCYQVPSSLRVHMLQKHSERYTDIIWVDTSEGDAPGVTRLFWVPQPAAEAIVQPDDEPDNEPDIEPDNEPDGGYNDEDEDGDDEPIQRPRRSIRARKTLRPVPEDDDDDSDVPPAPTPRAKRRTTRASKQKSSNKQSPKEQIPAQPTHTCPFCGDDFDTKDDFKQHLLSCLDSPHAQRHPAPPGPEPAQPTPVVQPVAQTSSLVAAAPHQNLHLCVRAGCGQPVMPGMLMCSGCDALYLYNARVRAEEALR
jgi:hypothetical protein